MRLRCSSELRKCIRIITQRKRYVRERERERVRERLREKVRERMSISSRRVRRKIKKYTFD